MKFMREFSHFFLLSILVLSPYILNVPEQAYYCDSENIPVFNVESSLNLPVEGATQIKIASQNDDISLVLYDEFGNKVGSMNSNEVLTQKIEKALTQSFFIKSFCNNESSDSRNSIIRVKFKTPIKDVGVEYKFRKD